MDVLERACKEVGTATALATKLGVTVQVISMWKARANVPAEYCRAIESATDGKVTRYDLRPDVFGPAPDQREAA